jgi:hypothetical protein
MIFRPTTLDNACTFVAMNARENGLLVCKDLVSHRHLGRLSACLSGKVVQIVAGYRLVVSTTLIYVQVARHNVDQVWKLPYVA